MAIFGYRKKPPHTPPRIRPKNSLTFSSIGKNDCCLLISGGSVFRLARILKHKYLQIFVSIIAPKKLIQVSIYD